MDTDLLKQIAEGYGTWITEPEAVQLLDELQQAGLVRLVARCNARALPVLTEAGAALVKEQEKPVKAKTFDQLMNECKQMAIEAAGAALVRGDDYAIVFDADHWEPTQPDLDWVAEQLTEQGAESWFVHVGGLVTSYACVSNAYLLYSDVKRSGRPAALALGDHAVMWCNGQAASGSVYAADVFAIAMRLEAIKEPRMPGRMSDDGHRLAAITVAKRIAATLDVTEAADKPMFGDMAHYHLQLQAISDSLHREGEYKEDGDGNS